MPLRKLITTATTVENILYYIILPFFILRNYNKLFAHETKKKRLIKLRYYD